MSISLDDLAERALRLPRVPGRRAILGIVGPPGAGKSTLAAALVARLGPRAALLPMDGYHLAQEQLEAQGTASRKGAPDTFDSAGFVAMLRRVRSATSETAYAPRFDRSIEEPIAGAIAIAPQQDIVVVEGNYLLLDSHGWSETPESVDEFWYLAPPPDLRRERLVARHRSFGRSAESAAAWVDDVDERNAELIERSRARAHLIITAWSSPDAPKQHRHGR